LASSPGMLGVRIRSCKNGTGERDAGVGDSGMRRTYHALEPDILTSRRVRRHALASDRTRMQQ
jgi:hypothetical protein